MDRWTDERSSHFALLLLCRESLAFATEPVFASLANVLGLQHNLSNPVPAALEAHKLYDVEIKYGLLQVTTTHFTKC